MGPNSFKAAVSRTLAATCLLLTATVASAQITVNLTAARQTTLMPDGNSVPMWGWACGAVTGTGGSCTALNRNPQTGATNWQPPLIVVPTGQGLTINLTNNLPVETSITIVGQIPGGGLGSPVRELGARTHTPQTSTTWTQVITPGQPFTPPGQAEHARSFAPEAAAGGGKQPYTWSQLNPGTYLIETGTYPSIQGPMGLYGVLVVTQAPVPAGGGSAFAPGVAYTDVNYDTDVPLLLSEIDPVQNASVDTGTWNSTTNAARAGFNETTPYTPNCAPAPSGFWAPTSSGPPCYPAAVNYTPLYYLINGVSLDATQLALSQYPVGATASSGNVLLRFVNAGSRMHIPTVVGNGMQIYAQDGHVEPDVALAISKKIAPKPKTQSGVFMPAGKAYDIVINPASSGGTYTAATIPVFDRELSLSTNNQRDGGMQGFLVVNGGAAAGTAPGTTAATVSMSNMSFVVPHGATTFSANALLNDVGVHNAGSCAGTLPSTGPETFTSTGGNTVVLNPDGTFTYTPPAGFTSDSFTFCGNGSPTLIATVTLTAATVGAAPTANSDSYISRVSSLETVLAPGVLLNDTDPTGYPLHAVLSGSPSSNCTVTLNADGSFTAVNTTAAAAVCTFSYNAVNSQGTASAAVATVTVNFPAGSGLVVVVQDANTKAPITDYKWIIEQDLTFYINPACQQNVGPGGTPPSGCPPQPNGIPPTLGTNFHTSYMPVVAAGCTGVQSCELGQTVYDANPASPTFGQHVPATCEGGICTPFPATSGGAAAAHLPFSTPSQVNLPTIDPITGNPARYYLSILPGDAANAFNSGFAGTPTPAACSASGTTPTGQVVASVCGHTMGGGEIAAACTGSLPFAAANCTLPANTTVNIEPNPLPPANLAIYVFEDDNELNGEIDAEPGAEPGLGDFQLVLWDDGASTGDAIGQMTYDMFNEPLTNALNGTIDPFSGNNACPISATNGVAVGVVLVCPHFESDGATISPLEGQAVVPNLMPARIGVIAHPGAAREARGEEWLQTTTTDGSHYIDSFVKAGEPPYFVEYSPAGWHVTLGFANPEIINRHLEGVCTGKFTAEGPLVPNIIGPAGEQDTDAYVNFTGNPIPCLNEIKGQITNLRFSRPPDERLYDSGVYPEGDPRNRATLAHTTCYISLGVLDSPDLAFQKCDANGNFDFKGIPDGDYSVTVFDQWLDQLMFEKEVSIAATGGVGQVLDIGTYPVFSWQAHIWTRTFMDVGQLGRPVLTNGDLDPVASPGLIQVPTRLRFRNGKFSNTLLTDAGGHAYFNEIYPNFNWFAIETDTTRFRPTGVHSVYDVGGPADSGPTDTYGAVLNSKGTIPSGTSATCNDGSTPPCLYQVPSTLYYPGAYYCGLADCSDLTAPLGTGGFVGGPGTSAGRVDPGSVVVEGIQAFAGQNQVVDWGKIPYEVGENGGIHGHVVYNSTRPFDDPSLLFQNLWEPLVPNVTVNLYQEGTAPDGTVSLTLVDTTTTSSFDSWAQGFWPAGTPNAGKPYMNCPGQDPKDPFFNYTLAGTTAYLNTGTLPNNAQYKCYDGLHALNQIQPAPYDGLYSFPSQQCMTPGATFTAPNGQPVKCVTIINPALSLALHTGALPAVLPTSKYVVEVVPPPNYEIVKEEDKNILIGDNFIAPVTQQFAPIVNIFIVPDQAVVASLYNPSYTGTYTATNSYSPPLTCTDSTTCAFQATSTNNGNPTTNMDRLESGGFGPGGLIVQNTPCVGIMRIVPDYMSISPQSGEVSPFAGALRPLCDRKEIVLNDQMQGLVDFYLWTKTPAAAHYTGFILDDFSSEYDPNSPDFGEKFAVPNLPVAMRDPFGIEVGRIYSDQWGLYNGLVYSTWEVNPPNPTGYAPNMMITCMNDPGPIPGPNGSMVNDPYWNPLYSDFCYENPFMPADTQYLDTPVVPLAAFAEGYNPPDCSYADTTPAILRVDGDSFGPWVSKAGNSLTITAIGDEQVLNHAYSGPSAFTAPYNEKFITRHYGFGTRCTSPSAGSTTCNTASSVSIGGIAATVTGWSDTSITVTVPNGLPTCGPPGHSQQNLYGVCGELQITAGNGLQSIDAVTVTVGGKTPTYINGENAAGNAIQAAIDAASPGDLIMLDGAVTPATGTGATCSVKPGANCVPSAATYNELLIVWKPLRLQGVGSASVIINANQHPAGKMTPWRQKVDCLFGLNNNGYLVSATNPASPGCVTSGANQQLAMTDPITEEQVVNWDATENGFVAELLTEPTLMGALEGAAITVVGKGWSTRTWDPEESAFSGTLLTNSTRDCNTDPTKFGGAIFPGNFLCAPSRIDGLSMTNSSAGGGGMFVHGWNHYLEVSNNHIYGNGGSVGGGIILGQLEVPDLTTVGGTALPYLFNTYLNIHNNAITGNISFGDEFNVDTNAVGGGVSICPGNDYYKLRYNFICGNMATGDGGGVAHYGLSFEGLIEHNQIIFNQSFNTTLPTSGGGISIEGEPGQNACEGPPVDIGCPPALSDGSGDVTINANLIQGNTAESGLGGGIALLNVNGTDVTLNPNNIPPTARNGLQAWWQVTVTNNVIVDNVAGWAGGGISLYDAVNTQITNNTVSHNDSSSSAGVEFDTVGANQGTVPPNPYGYCGTTQCVITNPITTSNFQAAGVVSQANGALLVAAFSSPFTGRCPFGNPNCTGFSNPLLTNNIISENRAFHITVTENPVPGLQNVVALLPILSQATTGQCPTTDSTGTSGPDFWDVGVIGDTQPQNATGYATGQPTPGSNPGGFKLNPVYSVLDNTGYTTAANGQPSHNLVMDPDVVHPYCNGSRVPPEIVASICTSYANAPGCSSGGSGGGFGVPPGIPDIDPFFPLFVLSPAATVDEGNNWINLFYGPLSPSNASTYTAAGTLLPLLANYAPCTAGTSGCSGTSPVVDYVPVAQSHPATDFFGNARPDPGNPNAFDVGAIETQVTAAPAIKLSATTLAFGNQEVDTTGGPDAVTITNSGTSPLIFPAGGISITGTNPGQFGQTNNCPTGNPGLIAGASCTVNVTFSPGSTGAKSANLRIADNAAGSPQTVALSGTGTQAAAGFSPPSPAMTTTPATTAVKTAMITVTNTGTGPLTLTANPTLTTSGTQHGTFSITGSGTCVSGAVVAAGGTCTIGLSYTPTTSATSSAHVTLHDSGAANANQNSATFNAN